MALNSPDSPPVALADSPVEAVVFDLDGTLVLSESRNRLVWEAFFRGYGIELDDALLRHITGRRGTDSLAEILHWFPERTLGELGAEIAEYEATLELPAADPVAGAAELVRSVAAAGLPVALVTSASRAAAETALAALGVREHFHAVVAAADVERGKPDPEGYLAACEHLGVPPSSAVGFEDTPAGVDALKAAGMRCVAVTSSYSAAVLAGADLVVADLTEVSWCPRKDEHFSHLETGKVFGNPKPEEANVAERRVNVGAEVGLHARPAAIFVQTASKAPVDVTVAKGDSEPVDAKSILAVLSLDVRGGDEVVLRAEGEGADEALSDLATVAAAEEPASA